MIPHSSSSRPRSSLASPHLSSMTNSNARVHALLVKHDPHVRRVLAYFPHVKVFHYSTSDLHWDNDAHIEGCLFAYERDQPFNNELDSFYALAFINSQQDLLQPIQLHMSAQAKQLRLFYQVMLNEQPEVFCVFFDQESECLRIHEFIQQAIKRMQRAAAAAQALARESTQHNVPQTVTHAQRIQTPVMTRNSAISEGPTYRTRTNQEHGKIETAPSIPPGFANFIGPYDSSPSPVLPANTSSSPEDLAFTLKRVLKIGDQHQFNDGINPTFQDDSNELLPPTAFAAIDSLPPYLSNNVAHNGPYVPPSGFLVDREHLRRVLIDLIRTDDEFTDAIHQACFDPRSLS